MELFPIAHIHTPFPEKFGVPRQSGIAPALRAKIVFLPPYGEAQAFRGIEGFSHLWLIWGFSKIPQGKWSPTVRPPRLGGNQRVGVFASRSPFRPNPLGLSSVTLEGLEETSQGAVLVVGGADLVDGTPIYDIKPYLPQADSHPQAAAGFAGQVPWQELKVDFPAPLLAKVPEAAREALLAVLAADPRPPYHKDSPRVYGMGFQGMEIKFCVTAGVLQVQAVEWPGA